MRKRRSAEQVQRLLQEADRDLATGLTATDICHKLVINYTTYYRWRLRFDSGVVDPERRVRELESEVERLKRLAADLMLDKQMLQDIAKKSGDAGTAACRSGVLGFLVRDLATACQPGIGPRPFDGPLSGSVACPG
jgi:putative transposase